MHVQKGIAKDEFLNKFYDLKCYFNVWWASAYLTVGSGYKRLSIWRRMHVPEWGTVDALTRVLFWCLFPELWSNKYWVSYVIMLKKIVTALLCIIIIFFFFN